MPGEHSHEGPDRQHHHDYRSCPLCAELERLNTEVTKEVWPAIDKLRDQQSQMSISVAAIGEQLKGIAGSLARVETSLNGIISKRNEQYEKALAGWKKGTLAVIGSILTALGAGLAWLLQWLIGGK